MYYKIFCPIDGSSTSTCGRDEAIRLAKDQGAKLKFLCIVEIGQLITYGPPADSALELFRADAKRVLQDGLAAAQIAGVEATSSLMEIVTGRTGPVIVSEAKAFGADLIVMGTHGRRGFSRMLLGSDAADVASSCRVPVLLVKHAVNDTKAAQQ